ncbi:MAG: hypothetical protein KJP07_19835 [Desulfatitalea sp.]|nr:hypothetical protein [Desulfatitalea sp.]
MLPHRPKKNCVYGLNILIVFVFCIRQHTSADDDLALSTKDIQINLRSLGLQQSDQSIKSEQHFAGVIQAFSEALASEDKEARNIVIR